MKMKLRFSPFPTKGIHSLNFFSRDRQILFEPFLMMDFCFTRCFSYYVEWQVHKLQTKKLPFITWFITSHLDVYNSMEHAHPSERCTHSTYICGSHIESSSIQKKFMQILCQWLVSPPIYMLRANRPQKQFSHLQFCEGWENENRHTSVAHINCSLSTGFPGQM
jgi:hypothetical protein